MKSSRPTLRSLAAEAGVSAMTFSLALRNSSAISARTRQRLQRLARVRGYQPDPTISKLMQHLRMRAPNRTQANICGLVRTSASGSRQPHAFADRVQDGLRQRAESLGFAYDRLEISPEANSGSLQRILRSRGVEGVVFLPMPGQSDLSGFLKWDTFSVVSVTSSVTAPRVHSVTPNHFDNMLHACRQLAADGHRRLGLAISQEWDERVRHRWAGGIAWQNTFGETLPIPPFIGRAVGPRLADQGFVSWLLEHRPDVVLVEAIDETLLSAALRQLPARERPRVVTLDWPDPPAGSGVDQRPEVIGSVAIEILAGMIARGERGLPEHPLAIMVEGVWVPGRGR